MSLEDIYNNTHDVYTRYAKAFDEERGKNLFEKKWLDLFISHMTPHGHILDVGCGSAEPIAKYFIEEKFQISGVDYSKAMIDLAKNNYPQLLWKVVDMRNLNMENQYDGLVAWNSFFHLKQSDQPMVLSLFAKHLKSGAPLLFTAGPEKGEVRGKIAGRDVYHSSLEVEDYKFILNKNEMKLIDYKLNDPECALHSVFLAKKC